MNQLSTGKAITKFLLYLHPNKIEPCVIVFNRTFGFGGIVVLIFVILFIIGIMLRFTYIPSGGGAYEAILTFYRTLM